MDINQYYFDVDDDRNDGGAGPASESYLQDTLKSLEPLRATEPEKYAPRFMRLLCQLAALYAAQNKFNSAASAYCEALALAEQRVVGPDLAHVLTGQAFLHATMGQPELAEAGLQRALEIMEGMGADNDQDAADGEPASADEPAAAGRQYDAQRALILKGLGNLRVNMGDLAGGRAYYQRVAALYERLSTERPVYLGRIAQELTDLAILSYRERSFSDAGALFARAQAIYEPLAAADPEAHEAGLSTVLNYQALMAGDEDSTTDSIARISQMKVLHSRFSPRQGPVCAEILLNLGVCYTRMKDFAGARDAYVQVLEIYGQLDGINPGVCLPARAWVLHVQGSLYRDFGHLREAATKYYRAIEIRRKLAADYPSVHEPPLARILHSLGKLYIVMEEKRQAILTFGEAISVYERLAVDAPDLYVAELSLVYLNMGVCMMEKNDPGGAKTALEKALPILQRLTVADPFRHERSLVVCLQHLAYLQAYEGQYREAHQKYQQALQIKADYRHLRPDRYAHETARIYRDIGRACLREGALGQAEEALTRSLEMYKALEGARPGIYQPKIEDVLTLLEKVYAGPGDEEPSLPLLQKQLAVYAQLDALRPGDWLPQHAAVLTALAFAWEDAGNPEEAVQARLQAHGMYEELIAGGLTAGGVTAGGVTAGGVIAGGETAGGVTADRLATYRSALAESLFWLAILYERQDEPSAAEDVYRHCLDVYDRIVEEEGSAYHPQLANVLMYYGKFLLARGEAAAGQEQIDRASALAGGNRDAITR